MNKKFTKRLLCRISAAILSLVLLFSALPMTAFAANGYYQLKIGLPGRSFWAAPFMEDDNVYWFNDIGMSNKESLTDSNGNTVGWNAYFEKSTKTLHLRNIECGFIFITDGCNKIELEGVNSIVGSYNDGIGCTTPHDGKLQIYSKGNTEATLNISTLRDSSNNNDIYGIRVTGRKYGRDYNGLLDISGKTNVNISVSQSEIGKTCLAYGIYADEFEMYGKSLNIKYLNYIQNKSDNPTTFFGIYCFENFNNSKNKIKFLTQADGTVNIDCHEAAYGYPFSADDYEFEYVKSLTAFAGYSQGDTFCNKEAEINDLYIARKFRLPEYSSEVFELNRQFESLGKAKVKVVGANFLYKLHNNDGFTYYTATGMDTAEFYKNDWIDIKAIDYESSGKKFESWKIYDMHNASNELTSEYLSASQQKQEQITIIPSDGTTEIEKVLCVVPRYKYLVSIRESAQGNVEVSGEVSDKAWVGADPVTLTAVANNGYQFSHWKLFDSKGNTSKDDGAIYPDFTDAQLKNETITLPAGIGYNYQIQPIFELKDYNITYKYQHTDGKLYMFSNGRLGYANWKSGASIVNTYKTGDTTVLPRANDIVYRGYKFMGWYADKDLSGSPITFIRADWSGNKVFYAKFEKDSNADYGITVNPKGDYSESGGSINATAAEAKAGQTVYFTVDPNPGFAINSEMSISVKSGSTAISYTKVSGTDNLYSFVMPSGNVTVNVTNPFKLCQYTITYNANGGRPYGWSNLPVEYNVRGVNCKLVDDNTIKLIFNSDIPAFRKGYIFAGWCRTADCSDEPITSIPLDGTISGNLTLYACWVKTDHPVNVNINSIDNVEYAIVELDKKRYSMGEEVKFMIKQVGRSMVKRVEIEYTNTTDTGAEYTVRENIDPDSSGFYSFIMPGLVQGRSSESKLKINVYSYPICNIEYNDDGGKVTFSSALGGSIITCLKEGLLCINVTARPGYKKGADFKLFANGKEITLDPGFSYYTIPINDHTTITVSGVEETGLLYGDVNSDGKLDIIDLVRLKKHIAGVPGLTLTEEQLTLADVNTDGEINAGDLIALRTMLLNSK